MSLDALKKLHEKDRTNATNAVAYARARFEQGDKECAKRVLLASVHGAVYAFERTKDQNAAIALFCQCHDPRDSTRVHIAMELGLKEFTRIMQAHPRPEVRPVRDEKVYLGGGDSVFNRVEIQAPVNTQARRAAGLPKKSAKPS